MTTDWLYRFVQESNKIEGIVRPPTPMELEVHEDFLCVPEVRIDDVENLVSICAGAKLRRRTGDDVRVGNHHPPPGGPGVERSLKSLLAMAALKADPFDIHVRYETLHPFMDGNGRSGRALWLHQMERQQPYGTHHQEWGFLHTWYYQSLKKNR